MRRNDRAAVVFKQAMRPWSIRPVVLAAATLGILALVATAWGASRGSAAPGPAPALPALTTRQLVGQHLIYAYSGLRPPAALERRIARGEAAGVILFNRNIASRAQLRAQLARLQAIPRPAPLRAPLLVMIDQEGGFVKRLSGAPQRSPGQIGRSGSTSLARSEGVATAANLHGVGINVDLAPVLDVGRRGSYQERLERSYGRDPSRVGRLGTAFAGGLRAGGGGHRQALPGHRAAARERGPRGQPHRPVARHAAQDRRGPVRGRCARPHRPGDAEHGDLPGV